MRKKNDTKEENGKLLLSVKETCELTGLSEKTVRTIMAEMISASELGAEHLYTEKNSNTGWRNRTLEYFLRTC